MAKKGSIYNLAFELSGKVEKSFDKSMGKAQGALGKVAKVAGTVVKVVGTMAVAAATAAVAVGKAAYNIAKEFDDAYDKVRIGTGATGEALEGLKDSVKNIYASLPTDLDKASTAVADYNTLLGLSGETLENISKQAIQVEALLGDDLSEVVSSSSHAFSAWNIAAENMSAEMDYIFKVAQSTGAGFTSLTNNLQFYAAQLQELGYDFETATTLLGNIEKAGYDVATVMNAMKKATTTLSKAGIDATEGLEVYYEAIRMAGDETEAIAIATEVFGERAATTMAYAIRNGTLEVEGLTEALQKADETILGVSEDTWDFADRWQILKNQLAVEFEPAAMEFFDGLSELMPDIAEMAKSLIPVMVQLLKSITSNALKLFSKLMPALEKLIPIITQVLDTVIDVMMPVLEELFDSLLPVIVDLLAAILPVLSPLIQCLMPVIKLITKIIQIITPLITGLMPVIVKLLEALAPILDVVCQLLTPILEVVTAIITPLLEIINSVLGPIITLLNDILTPILQALVPIIQWVADMFSQCFSDSFGMVGEIINYFMEGPLGGLINVLKYIIEFISNVFKGNWDAAWKALGNIPIAILNGIIGGFESMINFCISAINSFTKALSSVWTWTGIPGIPEIPKVKFGRIPMLAEGGITTGPTFAEIGEGAEQEVVMPLSKLADVMSNNGYGDVYNNNEENHNESSATFNPNFTFNINGSGLSPEEIQEIVVRAIEAWWASKQKNEKRYAF